jgi:hypothetical protein
LVALIDLSSSNEDGIAILSFRALARLIQFLNDEIRSLRVLSCDGGTLLLASFSLSMFYFICGSVDLKFSHHGLEETLLWAYSFPDFGEESCPKAHVLFSLIVLRVIGELDVANGFVIAVYGWIIENCSLRFCSCLNIFVSKGLSLYLDLLTHLY